MTKDRTIYWREYARKNAEKRKAIRAAYRERNREKINADKCALRAARAIKFKDAFAGMTGDQRVGFIEAKRAMTQNFPDETKAIRLALNKRRRDTESAQKSADDKAEALLTLREKFAAFRAAKNRGTNE